MSGTKAFSIRLSPDDTRRLDDLAKHFAVNASSVVRMLIKQAHDKARLQEQRERPLQTFRGDE